MVFGRIVVFYFVKVMLLKMVFCIIVVYWKIFWMVGMFCWMCVIVVFRVVLLRIFMVSVLILVFFDWRFDMVVLDVLVVVLEWEMKVKFFVLWFISSLVMFCLRFRKLLMMRYVFLLWMMFFKDLICFFLIILISWWLFELYCINVEL